MELSIGWLIARGVIGAAILLLAANYKKKSGVAPTWCIAAMAGLFLANVIDIIAFDGGSWVDVILQLVTGALIIAVLMGGTYLFNKTKSDEVSAWDYRDEALFGICIAILPSRMVIWLCIFTVAFMLVNAYVKSRDEGISFNKISDFPILEPLSIAWVAVFAAEIVDKIFF